MTIESTNTCSHKQCEWHAVYTRHQHEKLVAASLAGNGFEVFLPTYDTIRQWSDRKKRLSLPLFPCYVFVRSHFERQFQIITTPGVHSMIMFAGRPAVISETEVDAIRRAVDSKLGVEPHPFLRCGDWVRVTSGPLTDVEGILIRRKSSYRLILSAELLGKSIAVEMDAFSVRPIPRRTPALHSLASLAPTPDRRLAG
jgi:transcription antitermination factor NusG